MKRSILKLTAAALGIWLSAMAVPAWAGDNDGQADLDKAMEKKLGASTTEDLGEVLSLSESAIKEGLTATNLQFANDLYNSTLLQRGTFFSQRLFDGKSPPNGAMKDRELALADLEKLVGREPKEGSAYLMIARLQALRKQDHDAALKAANKAVELIKDEPNLQAAALVVRGELQTDPDKELADFDAAVKIVPTDSDALWGRAVLLEEKKKYEPALADLDTLEKQIPKNLDGEENAAARVRAIRVYEKRGELLFQLKRTDQALASYEESIKLQPNQSGPYVRRALVRAELKDTKEALEDLDKALAIDPDSATVLLARARVYQFAKDLKNARADVDTVLKNSNEAVETIEALELRAAIAAEEKDFDQAIKDLEALEKFAPNNPELLLQIGRLYAIAKQSRKAIEKYDAALAIDDKPWILYRVRGDAYLNIGKQSEAIRDYEKAIKAYEKSKAKDDDDHAGLLNNLAWILATSPDAKLRDPKRSIDLGTKACEETKYKEAYILSTLAAGYAEKGDFDSAAKWSKKAVEAVGPKDAEMKPELEKELKSYQDKKPWRESLSEDEKPKGTDAAAKDSKDAGDQKSGEKDKPADSAKPDAAKPDAAKPDSGKAPAGKAPPDKSAADK